MELEQLERQEREMVEGELQNIEEVEADEQSTIPSSNDFLFDVSSEQVKILADFNQGSLINTSRTIIRGTSSS